MLYRAAQAVLVTLLFAGASAAQTKTAITISPSNPSVAKGKTVQLSAYQNGGKVSAQWSSSATSVATVNGNGLVTALAAGKATISAKRGSVRASTTVTVTTPTTTTTTSPTPTSPTPTTTTTTVDPSWIVVNPGESIQAKVDLHPTGTTFYLKSGVHRRQTIRPKSGNRFIGEAGAVLDGEGVTPYAFETLRHVASNVTIKGLIIQRYMPTDWFGAIQADNGADWLVESNEIRDNAYVGLRAGPRMRILRNKVYRNGRSGITGFKTDGVLVEGNEVFQNNPSGVQGTADSGMKFLACHNLTIRGNHVYGNTGKGIWSDTNYPTVLIENNRVTDNRDAGIWHEIGYAAVIRYNTVERNGGTTTPSWLQRGGINVSNSPNVQVYGNTVLDNANGIGVMYASGYPTTGPYGAYVLQNLVVRDNTVRMKIGRTGMSTNTGDKSIYTSRNNKFSNNKYTLGLGATYFAWYEYFLNELQWQGYGNDTTGTFTR